jgi:hypothetical protein
MKRKNHVVASVLAAKNAMQKPPTGVDMAVHQCVACDHKFSVQASLDAPFCMACGGDTKRVKGKYENLSALASSSLLDLVCANCSTHSIMSEVTAAAHEGSMNCVTCGTTLTYELAAEDEDLDNDEDTEEESSDEDDDSVELSDDDSDEGDDDEDDESEESNVSTGTETSDDEIPDSYLDDEEDDTDGVLSADEDGEDDEWDDVDDEAYLGGDSVDEDEGTAVDTEEVALLNVAPKKARTRFVRNGNRVVAYVGSVAVAHLGARKETANVFDTDNYLTAIRTHCANKGLQKTISSFGFKLVKVKLDKKAIASAEVAKVIASEKRKMQAAMAGDKKLLRQCLEIASSGYNRDMFKEEGNALKAELHSVLASLNVKNPSKVIQSVFAAAADSYHNQLLNKAFELASMPKEVRQELAKALCGINPDMDDGDDEDVSEEAEDFAGTDDDTDVAGDETDGEDEAEEQSSFEVRSSVSRRLSVPVTASAERHQTPRSGGLFPKRTS